ncbi:MAG: pyruvate, water dikinase [Actinobacteria bacterium]|nr:pyruvate, water dikinase [Actinomycetota bacterium]
MIDPVVWFDDSACCDVRVAGGKGASLAAMSAAGLNVPPGFVIRADVMASCVEPEALRSCAIQLDWDGAQGLVRDADPPRREISGAYERLRGLVAVRSSACAEDSEEASFAGQHETFLEVEGADEVCDRVVECWASFFGERALFYRSQKGSLDDLEMAVVVQTMIDAEKSGVLFTVDPVARRRDRVLVEAVYGLGEQVVSGEVTPDHYITDRKGEVKTERLVHGGVLTRDELRTLVEAGTSLEGQFGMPQDIEWAIADGTLYLLQSRPVTTL